MIVDYAAYVEGRRSDCGSLGDAVRHARGTPGAFVWIGVADPSPEQVRELAELLDLPPLAVEDIEHGRQRPKLETYPGLMLLAVSSLHYDDAREAVETGHLMALTTDSVVLTLRYGQSLQLAPIRASLEAQPDLLEHGPAAVVHAVVDRVVDDYGRVLADLEVDVEQIEAAVFENDRSNHAERIYRLKREVLEFRRALAPVLAPLDRLVRGGLPGLEELTGASAPVLPDYFRDVLDHARRDNDLLESLDRLLDSASEANSSQVSMYQNADQRKISAWAAIALVPTIVGGIFGMNFTHFPTLTWQYGFWIAMGFTAAICGAMYAGFRRNDWL